MKSTVSSWWARIAITLLFVCMLSATFTVMPASLLLTSSIMLLASASLLLCFERLRGSLDTSGLVWHTNSMRLIVYGVALAVGMIAAIVIAALVLGARLVVYEVATTASVTTSITVFIVGASFEEVLFRGTIFEAIHERFGAATAVLGTGLLFGAAHTVNPDSNILSVVNTSLAGILLGVLVAQSHSLYAAISFHASWNVLVGLVVGNVSGMDFGIGVVRMDMAHVSLPWLFGHAYGVEEGALTTGLLVFGIMLALKTVPLDAETRAARYRRSFSHTYNSAA